MFYFIVRLAVTMLALWLTLNLLPGLRLDQSDIVQIQYDFTYDKVKADPEALQVFESLQQTLANAGISNIPPEILVQTTGFLLQLLVGFYIYAGLAVVFWFWTWLLWPLFLLFTGQIVIWTFGLFLVVINALLFYWASERYPFILASDPTWLWIALGGLSYTLWLFVLEGMTGLDSPLKDRPNRNRRYWRVLRLSLGGRNYLAESRRIAQSLDTITRYSKDIIFDSIPVLGSIRRFFQRIIYWRRKPLINESTAETVRYMLQELGPTYIELGQIVSSRADRLPPEWREQMSKLESNVAPFPFETAEKIIQRELRAPMNQLYAAFNKEPLTADSTAQVHRATLPDGQEVVVKVQRPDIDITVRADLNVVRDLTLYVEKLFSWARNSDIRAITNECADNILRELDYTNVAFNGRMLARNMQVFPEVHVPAVYPDMSTSRVMTQEFIRGVTIAKVKALDAAGVDRTLLATIFMRAIVKQVLYDGFFHGDPHRGNVLVNTDTSQIIFLNLGMIGTLTSAQRTAMADLLWALSRGDRREIAKTVLGLTTSYTEVDEEAFVADVDRLLTRYTTFSDSSMFISGAMKALLDAMYSPGLRMDPQFTLALKAMIQAEETVRTLDPSLSLVDTAFAATKELVEENMRLDVATPQSVVLNESFDLAVALVQPGSPALTIDDQQPASSEEDTIYRPDAEEVIRYRIGVTGANCEVSPPHYVILLRPGENSKPRFFQITPHKTGSCTLVVNAYQEDDVLAAQTRVRIQVQVPVRKQPDVPPQKTGESATMDLVLTPSEIEQFKDALHSAFQRPGLEQVVFFGLEVRLDDIVARSNYDKEVTDLVMWANDNNKVAAMLQEARKENPGNVKLREFAAYIQTRQN